MKILIFHANAGHGHRKVAEVIAKTLHAHGLSADEVKVRDALDFTPAFWRKGYPATYLQSVTYTPKLWGWFYENLDRAAVYRTLYPMRHALNRWIASDLLGWVDQEKPDVILCTHFLSAELLASAKKVGRIQAKLITVITDFLPHTFWLHESTDFYWVMCDETRDDLRRRGIPEGKIKVGGIPVAAEFLPTGQKSEVRKKWNLLPDRFTLLLTSGSFGLGPQLAILEELKAFHDQIQCFVVCGNNQKLKLDLESRTYPFPLKIFGFVDFMPELMEASDLLIAKSGGSTTTESMAKGVPMVVMSPIPGQEMRNARILKEREAAFFMEHPSQIKIILKTIFDHPHVLRSKKEAITRLARPHAAEDLATFISKGCRP